MKLRIPKRPLHDPSPVITALVHYCECIDRSLPHLRTFLIVAGLVASLLRTGALADYLFGAGLLMHGAIWFQGWWTKAPWRR